MYFMYLVILFSFFHPIQAAHTEEVSKSSGKELHRVKRLDVKDAGGLIRVKRLEDGEIEVSRAYLCFFVSVDGSNHSTTKIRVRIHLPCNFYDILSSFLQNFSNLNVKQILIGLIV